MSSINRRNFISTMGLAGAGIMLSSSSGKAEEPAVKFKKNSKNGKLNLAFIGVGLRGRSHLALALNWNDVEVPAICDIDSDAISKAQQTLRDHGKNEAAVYSNDEYAYLKLLERDDIDAVIISTPWLWHTRMAVASMKAGKFVGLEVSAANTLEECWDLVNTYEETGVPCMLLENVCYARESLALLNMIRDGLFGEPLHATCGYRHDLRHVLFNDGKQPYGGGVEFGENGFSESKWRTEHYRKRNGDVYPTHGIGPVANWFDINYGNRFASLTSTATKSVGLNNYIVEHPEGGEDHPNADLKWKMGDIITTVIKTARDESIILTHDTSLPRPYSWGFTFQASKGLWCGQFEGKRIHIEGKSKPHSWEYDEVYDAYMKKYDHNLWKKYEEEAQGAGHGGIDYFTIKQFLESVREEKDPPINVYDAAAWSAITPLSEMSIANNSSPQYFPDFTRGRWMTNKPIFG